jgi:hypothetical protein
MFFAATQFWPPSLLNESIRVPAVVSGTGQLTLVDERYVADTAELPAI